MGEGGILHREEQGGGVCDTLAHLGYSQGVRQLNRIEIGSVQVFGQKGSCFNCNCDASARSNSFALGLTVRGCKAQPK